MQNKVNLANDLPKYLHSEIKLITTQCAIIEMENLGSKLHGALLILKNYVVHKCGHEGKPIPGAKCLLNMVKNGNPSHYIVCTQDREFQDKLRTLEGVPLLYLHAKTPVLEQPSEASVKKAQQKISGVGQLELEKISKLKEQEGLTETEKPKKKRKKKGPNPLSCKKKQKKPLHSGAIEKKESKTEVDKKKRKRIRIPQHIREEVLKRTYLKINSELK